MFCTMYLSSKIHRKLKFIFCLSKYDYDNNQKLQPVGFLKSGVLEMLTSWENQTVLQCLKHHKIYMLSDSTGEKCFTFNRIFLRTKNGIFPRSSLQRDLLLVVSAKRKLFMQLFLLLSFTVVA